MAISKNVAKGEKEARIVAGVILIPLSFLLTGVWTLLCVLVGVSLIITAFIGY